jgi:hypothetical protein
LVSMWTIIRHRYAVYLYIIPMLFGVLVAIYVIKEDVPPDAQLTYAAVFLGLLFTLIIGIVPYNLYDGMSKRFLSFESENYPEQVDFAINVEGVEDIVDLDPIFVDGQPVPRQEWVVPLEKTEKVGHWCPGVESTDYIAVRYHLSYKDRFKFKGCTVYHRGTPMFSRNAEKIFGYVVDINPVTDHLRYGKIPVIEVQHTYHGDKEMRHNLVVVDLAMAKWYSILQKKRERLLVAR